MLMRRLLQASPIVDTLCLWQGVMTPQVAANGCLRPRERGEMPQFAVLIYSDDSAHEPDKTATTSDEITICDEHAVELASQATMTAAWAFTPRSMAKAVRAEAVTDGPSIDSRQVVAGVYILEAPDLDAALATAATNPVVRQGGGLEVRPVHSGGPADPLQR
jgi:hypothetical protein